MRTKMGRKGNFTGEETIFQTFMLEASQIKLTDEVFNLYRLHDSDSCTKQFSKLV
jgi:hypothetical protein